MQKIVITGGTGFVGRSLCEHLTAHSTSCRLVVPTRRLVNGRSVQVLPTVDLVQADVHDPRAMAAVLQGADALVHLVAILHGSDEAFDRAHVQLPRSLAAACAQAGVRRVVHVSALGVGAQAPSAYLRSKVAGEAVWQQALAAGGDLTILRPSVIFGAEDRFTNLFAKLSRLFPVLPLAGAGARFQPVWVGDVAQAIVQSLLQRPGPGPIVECAGPQVMTLQEIVQQVGAMAGCRRPVVGLPEAAGLLQAAAMGLLPGEPMMSRDNVLSMRVPNVASGKLPGLRDLGITPQGLALLAPHFHPTDLRAR
ncbi:complex I NDUFA9 subunit family protein [Pseudaquabacterium pictum]|uniref:Complex I NDUFA9 subunit family protein n=1 Tax=Pseudaquabacterium pictum TaxID=2315236 RepID=A0A480AVW0_9BURK|nr:complex I NDUFA9 subunit family protein [Rubrivivax pictus]GCL63925.1 complex I NDUFA9 subunit family protein [Rubrivivax pictus]